MLDRAIHYYLKLAEAAGLRWPLPEDLSEQKLDELLFGQPAAPPSRRLHPPPDFAAIHRELQDHKDLTLELLWQEYKQADPAGHGYSRFCDLYHQRRRNQRYTLRQQHTPGEKLFVDYAGATIPIHDRQSGAVHPAAIFVAGLGFSSYTAIPLNSATYWRAQPIRMARSTRSSGTPFRCHSAASFSRE